MFLPFISTTSTGTCFSLMRKISKLVTTPWKRLENKFSIWFSFFYRWGLSCFPSFSPLVYLCSFRSPVHFHAQVISISLPVQFAVDNVEEVADTDLLTGRHLHQSHSGRDIFVLRYPECYDVVTRRPWEVPADTQTHRLLSTSLYRMLSFIKACNCKKQIIKA